MEELAEKILLDLGVNLETVLTESSLFLSRKLKMPQILKLQDYHVYNKLVKVIKKCFNLHHESKYYEPRQVGFGKMKLQIQRDIFFTIYSEFFKAVKNEVILFVNIQSRFIQLIE